MFEDFKVQSFHHEYHVKFCEYKSELAKNLSEGDFIILDKNIKNIYKDVDEVIKGHKVYLVDPSEEAKSYENIGNIINLIIESGFSKNNRLVAIGGGITQDITSFIASILLRGVGWIFVPTNLATQCDSCIGSKNTVNAGNFKNQLGGFHPPENIIIDYKFCDSLADREIASGLGEMMHYFLVDGVSNLAELHEDILKAKTDKQTLAKLVNRSLSIKAPMVELDEFDKGPRNVFNFGHSFGHALESATDYEVPHGIAVAYGMDLANLISAHLGLINIELRNSINPLLQSIWEDINIPEFEIDRYFDALSKDKKNIGNEVKVILTRGLGDMFKTTLPMTNEVKTLINNFFKDKLYYEQA